MTEVSKYSQLSNYKIIYAKSEAMGIELPAHAQQQLSQAFNFKWMDSHIRYVGTNIPRKLNRIFKRNFAPLPRKLKMDTFTWFGRSNILKMNVMPRLLYLFQMLPVRLPQNFLAELRTRLTRFVWAGRPPRLRIAILSLLKVQGGMGFPDPVGYYEASHLTIIMEWCIMTDPKLWVDLAQATVDSV